MLWGVTRSCGVHGGLYYCIIVRAGIFTLPEYTTLLQ